VRKSLPFCFKEQVGEGTAAEGTAEVRVAEISPRFPAAHFFFVE